MATLSQVKRLQAEVEKLKGKVVCERQLKIDAQAEVEKLNEAFLAEHQEAVDQFGRAEELESELQLTKDLFKKYVDHVGVCEGVNFLDEPLGDFTDEDRLKVLEITGDFWNQAKGRRRKGDK